MYLPPRRIAAAESTEPPAPAADAAEPPAPAFPAAVAIPSTNPTAFPRGMQ
jgi:hypothetical protein